MRSEDYFNNRQVQRCTNLTICLAKGTLQCKDLSPTANLDVAYDYS